jgi:Zn-dependent peptidase ImmA (M78 family)
MRSEWRFRPAEQLLVELGISDPRQIDLDAIAWHLGAVVRYRHMDSADATIVGSDRCAVIAVNSSRIETRQRFSLAHEIGHWQQHRGRILFCTPKDIGNPARAANDPERQADRFASDLILPPYMVRPRLEKLRRIDLAAAHSVAKEFGTSMTATLVKVVDQNLFPVVVVCHGRNGRRWFRRSAMVPEIWFPRIELDLQSYAFAMLYRPTPEQSAPSKIQAGAWFEFRDAYRHEIREQSFPLPNAEVLTILTLPTDAP